jgi:hypothetical protein
MRSNLCIAGALLFGLFVSGTLCAQNRYALVIGNNNYRNEVTPLNNPVNDAEDIAQAAGELGYKVTLLKNVNLTDMIKAVDQFTASLSQNEDSEGFFWFAGHGLSVKEQHYLLPVDVNPENDNMISRTSYSVDELMGEIEKARNKTNLIVIDACRNKLLPGNSNRSRSVGSRGLAVLSLDDARIKGNKIVYSTAAGKTAADGAADSRNSPFAEAFLHNIKSPQTFDDAFIDISQETMRLTKGEQEPYSMGTFAVKSYSLNLAGRQQVSAAQVSATAQAAQQSLQAGAVSVAQGSLNISTTEAGQLTIIINGIPYDFGTLPGYASMPVANVNAGEHQAIMRYSDGHMEQLAVSVARNQTSDVDFQYKIRPAPVPGAPAHAAAAYDDADTWKNKWLYLGFLGGYGSYSWEETRYGGYSSYYPYSYEYTETHEESLGIAGGVIQLQAFEYFALEVDLGAAFGAETLPLGLVLGVFTFRPFIFEIGVGAGYAFGLGAGFEVSFGVKLGGGVFFSEYLGLSGNETVGDALVNTFIVGYKVGLLDK